MPRAEVRVNQETLNLWNRLARIMNIDRASLMKVAMSQFIRRNRMLFKIEELQSELEITDLERKLRELKEIDADKLQIIKIPKKETEKN